MIILILFAFALIILGEVPNLIRVKSWKDSVLFSVILTIGFVTAILLYIGVDIPSPIVGVRHLFEDVFKLSYKIW